MTAAEREIDAIHYPSEANQGPEGYIIVGWMRGYDFIGLPEHALPTDTPLFAKAAPGVKA